MKPITIQRRGDRYFARTDGREIEIQPGPHMAFQAIRDGKIVNPYRAIEPLDALWWLLGDGEEITITEYAARVLSRNDER